MRVYLVSGFVFSACFALYSTVSALYRIQTVGLDPLELILVGSVLELSVFLFEIPTGVVADVYSRRTSVLIGYAVVGLGFLIETLHPSLVAVLIAQVIWGVGHTFISGANTAWLVDELENQGIGQVLVRRSQFTRAGALFGILASIGLGLISLTLPIRLAGAGLLGLAALLCFAMPETARPRRKSEKRTHVSDMVQTFRAGAATIRTQPTLLAIVGLTLIGGIASEPLDRLWELHLLQSFALPDWVGESGLALFGGTRIFILVAGIGVAEWVRRHIRLDDPDHLRRSIRSMNLAVIVSFALFALAPAALPALLGYIIGSLMRQAQGPLLAAWINHKLDRSVRATVLSMTAQADALGQVAGGPALGALGSQWGVRSALLASSALFVPIQWLLRPRRQTPAAPEAPAASEGLERDAVG